jgi:hypothetical protein
MPRPEGARFTALTQHKVASWPVGASNVWATLKTLIRHQYPFSFLLRIFFSYMLSPYIFASSLYLWDAKVRPAPVIGFIASIYMFFAGCIHKDKRHALRA